MISENLKQEALDFLNGVISESTENGLDEGKTLGYNSGYTKGYTVGLAEGKTSGYNSGYTKGYSEGLAEGKKSGSTSGYNSGYTVGLNEGKTIGFNSGKTEGYSVGYNSGYTIGFTEGNGIGYNSGYTKGYDDGYKIGQASTEPTVPDEPIIEPDIPVEPNEYSTEKAISNLKALKTGSYVFAIIDKYGNAYATVNDWKNAGSKEVLGIGYCTNSVQLCMGIKKTESAAFGGDGIKFNSKVYTTTKQWHNTSTSVIAAFDDMTGPSNTEGIMEGCSDSLAEKCYNVVFANGKHGYMPACGELRLFCKYFSQVDALLGGVGGDKIKTQNGASVYFSSTCKDKNYAWGVRYMNEGDAQPQANLKTKKLRTRVFVVL